MLIFKEPIKKKDAFFILATLALLAILAALPTVLRNDIYKDTVRVKALVVDVDNSGVKQYGIVKQGDQYLTIRILTGRYKGGEIEAGNMLVGKLELDKMFKPGDKALAVLDTDPETGEILYANVMDHYRINIEIVLFVLFMLLLLIYAGWTGIKAFLSFVLSIFLIWKIYVPGLLQGIDPLVLSVGIVIFLTAVIVFLIGGLNKRGLTAFLGAISGILFTALIAFVFGKAFRIHGAVRPFSEPLLYSGYAHLDLTKIFLSSIFVSASGAVMDLSMDIASAQQEVKEKHPGISALELVRSGFTVGRAVVGTMTTTLLLAYSGSFITLLMFFMAQGIPLMNILNLSYVSAEILHTLVGSFGLVLVAPLTAVLGGFLYSRTSPKAAARA